MSEIFMPELGDPVTWGGRYGIITAFCDEDGEVEDAEDALAITIHWSDGTFSAVLVSDLEFVREN